MALPNNFKLQRYGSRWLDAIQENFDAISAEESLTVFTNEFGASPTASKAENRAALTRAINETQSAAVSVLNVSGAVNYGLDSFDRTTWPDFSGATKPTIVVDYSQGDTYGAFPGPYDGAQLRFWMHTPQTPSPGQHDGNTILLRGAWAPVWIVSNDMDLSGARGAFDNRRAGFATMVNGRATWQVGQGTLAGGALTDEELSNFSIQKFSMPGDTIGDFSPLVIERKTGFASYGGGRNLPRAHHDFEPSPVSPANYLVIFDAPSGSRVAWRANGFTDRDILLRNIAGTFSINTPVGDALDVDYNTRSVSTNGAFKTAVQSPAFGANVSIDANLGNGFRVQVTTNIAFNVNNPIGGLNGQIIRIRFRNVIGAAMGAVTFGAGYKLAGAFVAPATGFNRTYSFEYDSGSATWYEIARSAADVAN